MARIRKRSSPPQPRCIVIAGPNGAGKTTFARDFLPKEVGFIHFVNADLIASGLSPLQPSAAALAAGRILLSEIDRLVKSRTSFAFESTLSGIGYVARVRRMKRLGYRIEIVYLKLKSHRLAIGRVRARVKQGGHDVPGSDVIRRFARSWQNFERLYRPLADSWSVYDNSGISPVLLEQFP